MALCAAHPLDDDAATFNLAWLMRGIYDSVVVIHIEAAQFRIPLAYLLLFALLITSFDAIQIGTLYVNMFGKVYVAAFVNMLRNAANPMRGRGGGYMC